MPVIACFSYGLEEDGSFGKVNEARCEKAAQLYKRLIKHRNERWILVTAGMIPNFPRQVKQLCIMQSECLQRYGVPDSCIISAGKDPLFEEVNILSTVGEVRAVKTVQNVGLTGPFYAVSHWFQLPRILWFGWWWGVYFRPVPVFRSTPWKSVAAELPKWFVAFVDPTGSNGIGRRATQWARKHQIW